MLPPLDIPKSCLAPFQTLGTLQPDIPGLTNTPTRIVVLYLLGSLGLSTSSRSTVRGNRLGEPGGTDRAHPSVRRSASTRRLGCDCGGRHLGLRTNASLRRAHDASPTGSARLALDPPGGGLPSGVLGLGLSGRT